jgi:hypothetical protein
LPSKQPASAAQAIPQLPQFAGSLVVSMQPELQHRPATPSLGQGTPSEVCVQTSTPQTPKSQLPFGAVQAA